MPASASATSSSSSSSGNKWNLCHQAAFNAENTLITVVPSFSYNAPLPLLSCPSSEMVGPFVAGMPVEVPLWIAKVLHQRRLAQIQLPAWLSTSTSSSNTMSSQSQSQSSSTVWSLTDILKKEKQSTDLTHHHLPFYYYEIARSLQSVLDEDNKATQVVLQDLVQVRVDKIRQNFHELSKGELQNIAADLNKGDGLSQYQDTGSDEGGLPMINVTGIASVELNKIGPFLQRAFSDYSYLTNSHNSTTAQTPKDVNVQQQEADGSTAGGDAPSKVRMARSRLRRFRGTGQGDNQ